jgi:hypothetical protein
MNGGILANQISAADLLCLIAGDKFALLRGSVNYDLHPKNHFSLKNTKNLAKSA